MEFGVKQAWSRGLRKQLPSRQYEYTGSKEIPNCINFSVKTYPFCEFSSLILWKFYSLFLRKSCWDAVLVTVKYVTRDIYPARGNIRERYKPPISLPSGSFRGFSRHLFRSKYLTFFQTNGLDRVILFHLYFISHFVFAFLVLRGQSVLLKFCDIFIGIIVFATAYCHFQYKDKITLCGYLAFWLVVN